MILRLLVIVEALLFAVQGYPLDKNSSSQANLKWLLSSSPEVEAIILQTAGEDRVLLKRLVEDSSGSNMSEIEYERLKLILQEVQRVLRDGTNPWTQ